MISIASCQAQVGGEARTEAISSVALRRAMAQIGLQPRTKPLDQRSNSYCAATQQKAQTG